MKAILRLIFLGALLPSIAYSQPAPGGTVVLRDSAIPSQRMGVNSSGEGKVTASQSGTWTVQPGNTANTTAWKVDGSAVTQPISGTVSATESGTWTVQPGNTANTTPWLTSDRPATAGGYDTFHLVSAGSTNATSMKASAGQIYGWYIYNSNAAARKVSFHNTAGTPTAGSGVAISLVIPATSGANVFVPAGIPFNTGIGVTTVTGLADNDTTAVAANDLIINVFYK